MLSLSSDSRSEPLTEEDGFSLVEAIVALTILALAATAFQVGLAAGSGAVRAVDMRRAALELAKSELERTGIALPLEDGLRTGRTPDGFEWVVEQRAQDSRQQKGRVIRYLVTVTVTWTDSLRPEPKMLFLTSIKLKRGT